MSKFGAFEEGERPLFEYLSEFGAFASELLAIIFTALMLLSLAVGIIQAILLSGSNATDTNTTNATC